jgi:hypothetical protein
LFDFAETLPDDYSTSDVVRNIVVPRTTSLQCRYVDLIEDQNHVAAPKYFLSHTWADKFKHVVSSVQSYFGKDRSDPSFATAYAWMVRAEQSRGRKRRKRWSVVLIIQPGLSVFSVVIFLGNACDLQPHGQTVSGMMIVQLQ